MGNSSQSKNSPSAADTKEDYKFVKAIGRGGFGRVWRVLHKRSGREFAMKVMSKARIITKKAVASIMKERKLMLQINSPFVVSVMAGFQDRTSLYSLMELLSGGDLRYHMNMRVRFSEEAVRFIVLCLMKALQHLHSLNIIHRDVKPQNIIFDEKGYCKLADFGIASELNEEDNSHHTSGTPGYMSPEVICRQNHGFCADYYAIGIVTYELIVGRRPFVGRTRLQIRKEVLDRQFEVPDENICSLQCANFINKLIQRKVDHRLGFHGVDEILDHPWLNLSSREERLLSERKLKPIFVPSKFSDNFSTFRFNTEESEQERQNALLLRNPEVQEQFSGYNFACSQECDTNSTRDRTMTLPNPLGTEPVR